MKITWRDILLFFVIGVIYLITVEFEDIQTVILVLLIAPYTGLVFILMFEQFGREQFKYKFRPQKNIRAKKAKAGRALKIITLAYCPACGDCMPLVPENRAPAHDGDEEIPQDDCINFVKKHFALCSVRHLRRKYLYVLFGPFRLKKVSWSEPIKTIIFLVFIKKSGLFLLKRWRVNIEEPLKYQLFPVYHWKVPALLVKMARGWIFG